MITLEEIRSTAPMRALSWKQPYGSAMLHGKIETRTRDTGYRGLVMICTSKQPYNEEVVRKISGDELFVELCKVLVGDETVDLDGYAIAVGRLTNSLWSGVYDLPSLTLQKHTFVANHANLWLHVYEEVTPIKPFPWKGSQGWRTVPSDIRNKIELLPKST